jgi:hypothetical protein
MLLVMAKIETLDYIPDPAGGEDELMRMEIPPFPQAQVYDDADPEVRLLRGLAVEAAVEPGLEEAA